MALTHELVINFHMTESCNYRCGYCYATWNDKCSARELHRQSGSVESLLEQLAGYFLNPNPVQQALGYSAVRINFAGGEPMLLGARFTNALVQARALGFKTSVITNGHYLDETTLDELAPSLSVLGISYDSLDATRISRIGRIDRKGQWLAKEKLLAIAQRYRTLNPAGTFKLNTVVNACNWDDSMLDFVTQMQPDKWKLLRVLPIHNDSQVVTDQQYRTYVEQHAELAHLIVEEDNLAMQHSYLMINPQGHFYQNAEAGKGYQYSRPILTVGVKQALSDVAFDVEAFSRRYRRIPMLAA